MGRKTTYYFEEIPKLLVRRRKNDEIIKNSAFEFDASPEAWSNYQEIYNNFIFSDYKCGFVKKGILRIMAIGKPLNLINGIKMSGDLAFNFNKDKVIRYMKYFPEIETEEKFLEEFHLTDYHELYENTMLIPVTGGLNILKNSLSGNLDRFDVYASVVERIIKEEDVTTKAGIVIDFSSDLVNFLNQYSIKDFFKEWLLIISENYSNALLHLAKEELDSKEKIQKYIALAHGYWEMRGGKGKYTGEYNNYWDK